MGISNLLRPPRLPSLWLSFSFILVFMTNFFFLLITAENNGSNSNTSIGSATTPFAPPPHGLSFRSRGSPFRPSIAVIVGVLTTVFSVTFLLLLYAKHCKRGAGNPFSDNSRVAGAGGGGYARKNSGIERAVIESLPIFRFASLRGQKDGLECAVCLNRFEPTEVLRLLPKCKHAFHVECVDTWLDAHSTCPLCRYRVDPEDILLVEDNRILYQSDTSPSKSSSANHPTPDLGSLSRVSGRHSFAGNTLEVIVEAPKAGGTSFGARRSLDSWNSRKKRNSEIVGVGCFDHHHHPRKDGLLLADKTSGSGTGTVEANGEQQRRLEHRIIISGGAEEETADGPNHRWSDVQPSDLLFLRTEMILGDSRRFSVSRGSRASFSGVGGERKNHNCSGGGGRNVINTRSVSEITGMSRFRSKEDEHEDEDEQHQTQRHRHQILLQQQHRSSRQQIQQRQEEQRKRQAAASRWMAWISQSQSQNHQLQQLPQPAVHGTTSSSSSVVV